MSPNEMQELENVAKALNAESDDINTIIQALNAKLGTFNVGIEVWLDLHEDHIRIGYAKVGKDGVWQLATKYYEEIEWNPNAYGETGRWEPADGASCKVAPLLQASRAVRIRALGSIPDLVSVLKQEAEENLASIRIAKKFVAAL